MSEDNKDKIAALVVYGSFGVMLLSAAVIVACTAAGVVYRTAHVLEWW